MVMVEAKMEGMMVEIMEEMMEGMIMNVQMKSLEKQRKNLMEKHRRDKRNIMKIVLHITRIR